MWVNSTWCKMTRYDVNNLSGSPPQHSTIVEYLFGTPLQHLFGIDFSYTCTETKHKVFILFTVRRGSHKMDSKTSWKFCENQFCLL